MRHSLDSMYRNHPILKEDALLTVFLTEPSFENWRKHSPISLDEESVSKRVDRMEEMSIPSDLEDKFAYVFSRHCDRPYSTHTIQLQQQDCSWQIESSNRTMAEDMYPCGADYKEAGSGSGTNTSSLPTKIPTDSFHITSLFFNYFIFSRCFHHDYYIRCELHVWFTF